LIETHHNTNARLFTELSQSQHLFTRIIKTKFHIPCIHSLIFTNPPTSQAPISPFLPKSSNSVASVLYSHQASSCQKLGNS
jgi:hypothetical protein